MRISDDERREVAARLRELVADWFDDGEFYDRGEVEAVLGLATDDGAWYEAAGVRRLADLIEPELERKCRVVTDKNAVRQTQEVQIHTKYCSECSYVFGYEPHSLLLPGLDEGIVLDAVQIPHYCPNCGAKVVNV